MLTFIGIPDHYDEVYTNRVKKIQPLLGHMINRSSKCFSPKGMTDWVDNNFTKEKGYPPDDWHP